jgi:hypothetical protein
MNLKPPPETDDIKELLKWCKEDLYRFLQYPAFHQMMLVPRSSAPSDASEGVKYYDSDDHKEKTHNGTDWQDTY